MKQTIIDNSSDSEFGTESSQLQHDSETQNVAFCSLADLLQYHDKPFILNVYATIARRQPSASELTQTLHDLRGGLKTKTRIVEDLAAKHPNVRVNGLRSPLVRTISRLPLIGSILRVLLAVGRLPILIQHQQQFEAYIVGQQQRLADHLNAVTTSDHLSMPHISIDSAEASDNASDVIKTVMILSDSLVDLSASVTEDEKKLEELCATLTTLQEALQKLQEQQVYSEKQLHSDLLALTQGLTEQQQHLEEMRRAQEVTTAAQREFLVHEQRAIVEAEREAVRDLQDQLTELSSQNSKRVVELTAELLDLRAALEEFQQAANRK